MSERDAEVMRAGALPIGRSLRMIIGVGLILLVFSQWNFEDPMLLLGILLGICIGYLSLHLALVRFPLQLNCYVGAFVALGPIAVVCAFGGPLAQFAVIVYIAGSLILDAVTGDSGCEVMAIPGLIHGQRTHLACLVFSPVDALEARLFTSRQ